MVQVSEHFGVGTLSLNLNVFSRRPHTEAPDVRPTQSQHTL